VEVRGEERGGGKRRGRSRGLIVAGTLVGAMVVLSALLLSNGMLAPPMVIESRSMQHDDDLSALGVLDTGDMVVIGRGEQEVRSYLASEPLDHRSFGELGDVIVFQTPQAPMPIIHRALVKIEYNASGGFDIPELAGLPPDRWEAEGRGNEWWNLQETVTIRDIGYAGVDVHIDLWQILRNMDDEPHGGFLTMGDNNWYARGGERTGAVDQTSLSDVPEPIKDEWILGKAVAEIPWIGLLKLTVSNNLPHYTPLNSVASLLGVITLMSVVSMVIASRYKIEPEDPADKRKRT